MATEPITRAIWRDEHMTALLNQSPEIGFVTEPSALTDLILKAQRKALPKNMRRKRQQIMHSLGTPPSRPVSPLRTQIARIVETMPVLPATATTEPEVPKALIRWRLVEWTRLAHDEEVKRLLAQHGEPDNVALLDATLRAMRRQLPTERQRERSAIQTSMYPKTGTNKKGLVGLLREGIKYQPKEPIVSMHDTVHMPLPTTEHAHEINEEIAQLVQSRTALQEQAAALSAPAPLAAANGPTNGLGGALAGLIDMAIGKLRIGIMESVNAGIDRAMTQALTDATEQLRTSNVQTITQLLGGDISSTVGNDLDEVVPKATDPKVRGPRVDVVGLLNGQIEVVKKAVGESFDLRFLSSDDVERLPVTAPCAIMMTKFVSHSAQERIKKQGKQVIYANGGVDSLLKELSAMKH